MNLDEILNALFPRGHQVSVDQQVIAGNAETAAGPVLVLGTADAAAIDHRIALTLAARVLDTIARHPRRPIVFLVDTSGQALSRAAELLCLNGSFAHLAQCVDLARRQGHPTLSLVTANAVSGGFLSFGLMADRAYALSDVQVRVMDLKAMARVTKIAHERLLELAASSPIFAPGAENYRRMGAIEAIWPAPSEALLLQALADIAEAGQSDLRMEKGLQRGGRTLAANVAQIADTAGTGV
ncbi:MAG TPA: biotin-independent malonate decarboxylase subunit gamma [Rhodocyclaceae bacterium]